MQTLRQFQTTFQTYHSKQLFKGNPQELYAPVNYIMQLGGKRIRPVLLLVGYRMFKDNFEKALPAAYSIELFHNFTLLHDDIMDEAPLRRGQPTVHTKYDLNTGILSGDVMLIHAYEYLTKVENTAKIPDILEVFNQVAVGVCIGQQYDINFEKRVDVQIKEYLDMIRQKTAVLLGGALQIGALLGDASQDDALHLYKFGENIGIAFQLQDDLLDTYGDPEKFGKKVGGDIVQNKKTYLVLKALELADVPTRKTLLTHLSTPTKNEASKIEKVRMIFNQLNIKNIAEQLQEVYLETAFKHLEMVQVDVSKKDILYGLANQLMHRQN